jgi:hypothetical protein
MSSNIDNTAMIFFSINTIFILITLRSKVNGDKQLFYILFFSYGIRFIFMLFDLYGNGLFLLPGSGRDTENFHNAAINFALYNTHASGYEYVVGMIYKLFGIMRPMAQYLNLLMSISTIIITIKIMNLLDINENIKYKVILILAFIPNYLITSVILLRESLMICLLALSLFHFICWWKNNNLINFILSIAFVLIASIFHSGVIANALVYILFFMICNNKERKMKLNFNTIVFGTIVLAGLLFVYNNYYDTFFGKFGAVQDVSDITNRTELAESGGSMYYVGGSDSKTFLGMIKYSPIRMFYFLASPLPWQWRGSSDIIAFAFSGLFYIACIINAIKALRISNKNRNIIIFGLMLSLFSSLIFGWGVSNSGTALRHRDKFLINYVVMLAVSLDSLEFVKKKNTINKRVFIKEELQKCAKLV